MKCLISTVAIAFLCSFAASVSQPKPGSENAMIKEYLKSLSESGYNTNVMPEPNGGHGSPIDVRCTMYLLDIHQIDDESMDYRAQFYFRQNWNDSRLAFLDQDISSIVLNDAQFIWTPDLFMAQEKEGILHNLMLPNVFIRILPNGEVLYSLRLSVTFTCPMDFRKYPHDTQKCVFSVESYGHTRNRMELSWDDTKMNPVSANPDINLLPFEFKGIKESVQQITVYSSKYTALQLELTFQRKTGFYMIRLYIPFIFLIILSWLSFWIPAKLIAPRLALLLVIMYLMVNIGSDINGFIPPASYTKGSDVWIAVCESLVFASFLEFIVVHIISRNKEKIQKRLCKNDPEAQRVLDSDSKMNPVSSETSNSAVSMMANRLKRNVLVSSRIDKASRILFPVLFLVFNFIYWIVYCTGH